MRKRRSIRTALLGATLLTTACGTTGSKRSAAPPPAAARLPVPSPEPALQDARRAEQDGRLIDALRLYDTVAARRDAQPPARTEALAHGAVLRLATDASRQDLAQPQAMLREVARLDAQHRTPVPATLLASVLQEIETLRTRTADLDAALKGRADQDERLSQQHDQKTAALRTENRQLREDLKVLQAELARKEEALRRAAEKLLNGPPGVY